MTDTVHPPVIVWFRQDLRLTDNPALTEAVATGAPVIPLYILDDSDDMWRMGGASLWWLHHALADVQNSLAARGTSLVLRRGNALEQLRAIIKETGATSVFWNRRYEPAGIHEDSTIKETLHKDGLNATSYNARLLFEPWEIKNGTGGPYKVFTPFWRTAAERLRIMPPEFPDAAPLYIATPAKMPASDKLESWGLTPMQPNWAIQMAATWNISEAEAHTRLAWFIDEGIAAYPERRDFPSEDQTSTLSPYLAFGQISSKQIWYTVNSAMNDGRIAAVNHDAAISFLRQLVWREFAYHLLFHFPHTPTKPLNPKYAAFPWRKDSKQLRAWQRGQTGYPIVDAGMRQLWQTGWMHNRVRMIVASFLVKHLLLSWQSGAEWFWDTLVDADLANNSMGWQWVAGSGADAAPYFRIFNPMLQSGKFEAEAYIRRYVPELAQLSDAHIHEPWKAPKAALAEAGVVLGETYPQPMVEHGMARDRALEALKQLT